MHTQKRSDKTTVNIYMSKNCDDAIDPSFEIKINYLAFHAFSFVAQFRSKKQNMCVQNHTWVGGVVVKVLEKEDVENLYLRCSLMKFQVFGKAIPIGSIGLIVIFACIYHKQQPFMLVNIPYIYILWDIYALGSSRCWSFCFSFLFFS